jgi:hypothetical protein
MRIAFRLLGLEPRRTYPGSAAAPAVASQKRPASRQNPDVQGKFARSGAIATARFNIAEQDLGLDVAAVAAVADHESSQDFRNIGLNHQVSSLLAVSPAQMLREQIPRIGRGKQPFAGGPVLGCNDSALFYANQRRHHLETGPRAFASWWRQRLDGAPDLDGLTCLKKYRPAFIARGPHSQGNPGWNENPGQHAAFGQAFFVAC